MIITTQNEYDFFLKEFYSNNCIVVAIPINLHRSPEYNLAIDPRNPLVAVFVQIKNNSYLIPIYHGDAEIEFDNAINDLKKTDKIVYSLGKKYLTKFIKFKKVVDYSLLHWLNNTELPVKLVDNLNILQKHYSGSEYSNYYIPLVKHYEQCKYYIETLNRTITLSTDQKPAFEFYNNTVLPFLSKIETNGMPIDLDSHYDDYLSSKQQRIIQNAKISGNYSIYTTTGRPTYKKENLNFLSLNKSSGIRKIFKPLPGYKLVQFDYNSYHIRLADNLVGNSLGRGDLHMLFASNYFNKLYDEITPEERDEAKKITFRQLYGDIEDQYKDIIFFKKVIKYKDQLYNQYITNKFITTPMYGRRMYFDNSDGRLTPTKLFNYHLQSYEMEHSITRFAIANDRMFEPNNVKIHLYLYDSILVSMHTNKLSAGNFKEIIHILDPIKGRFPVNVSVGNDYDSLKPITLV